MAVPWSGLVLEASSDSMPELRIRTRGPSKPRRIGRLAPLLKELLVTPGCQSSAAASEPPVLRWSSCV